MYETCCSQFCYSESNKPHKISDDDDLFSYSFPLLTMFLFVLNLDLFTTFPLLGVVLALLFDIKTKISRYRSVAAEA